MFLIHVSSAVITSPTTQSVLSAENLVLTCTVGKSSETMAVAWYKGGVAITSGIVSAEVSGNWQSLLTLSSVSLANDASYYCEVTYSCTTSAGCSFTGGVLTSASADITVISEYLGSFALVYWRSVFPIAFQLILGRH